MYLNPVATLTLDGTQSLSVSLVSLVKFTTCRVLVNRYFLTDVATAAMGLSVGIYRLTFHPQVIYFVQIL